MIIKPSTALRNEYGTISDMAHEEDVPIYITKNGEGDLVVIQILLAASPHTGRLAGRP